MNIQSIVENEITQDPYSVWCLNGDREFGYSDGAGSEKYLWKVFTEATDLSTGSPELQRFIKDWPSEYHLTIKRAQLLSGFSFDRSLRVLEVGCGCGAITRHLGESFDQVISVEGSINRARLARLRTRDLQSVSILCAPFQEIRFSQKFDIIFCIGVFEYSASFIQGDDPYDAALRYFSDMLTPEGMVVIAIENQFGLKYLSGVREDHLGVMFEGLEGYHRQPRKVRTFGKVELELRLKKYFPQVNFYYPYPDYKVPDCVISSEFLGSGRAGELVSQMQSRDYSGPGRISWDEATTTLELARNRMLEFFSHSFLVVAGRGVLKGVAFDQLAILFSSGRKPAYSTITRIVNEQSGQVLAEKRKTQSGNVLERRPLRLVNTDSTWIDGLSLQTQLALRARADRITLTEIFEPCKHWMELLLAESSVREGIHWLNGTYIDSIWSNTYVVGCECRIVDREWIWEGDIRLNVVVIRAIYDFLSRIETTTLRSKALSARSGELMIQNIATALGIRLETTDFAEFIRIESDIAWIVSDIKICRHKFFLRWFLADRPTRRFVRRAAPVVRGLVARVQARISNLV
jgi:SAM-dependent methyltransferase